MESNSPAQLNTRGRAGEPETKSKVRHARLESAFGRDVDKDLREIGAWFYNCQQLSVRGIPDRLGCIRGKLFALELKRSKVEGRKTSGRIVLQRHILNKITKAGGYARVVYPENWAEVLEDLKKL